METFYLLTTICSAVYIAHLLVSQRDSNKELHRLQAKLSELSNTQPAEEVEPTTRKLPLESSSQINSSSHLKLTKSSSALSHEETLKRALELLRSKQIPSALEFILNKEFQLRALESNRLHPVGYEHIGGKLHYTFNFDGTEIEVIRGEREPSPALMPGDPFFTVTVDLLIDGELVFATEALEDCDEFGFFTYSLWTGNGNVSCILIDVWIEKIHPLRRHLEDLIEESRKAKELKEADEAASKMVGKVSLGPYADINKTENKG